MCISRWLTGLVVAIGLSASSYAAEIDWQQLGDANWTIEGNSISANDGNGFLVTPEHFDSFHLKVEFKPETGTNSGIFLRCSDPQRISDVDCYEVNIFDSRPDQSGRTGAIVNVSPPQVVIDTEEQWNTFETNCGKVRVAFISAAHAHT